MTPLLRNNDRDSRGGIASGMTAERRRRLILLQTAAVSRDMGYFKRALGHRHRARHFK